MAINRLLLLGLNLVLFGAHIYTNCEDVFYFFQLTIIGQVLVILNFILSLSLKEKSTQLHKKLLLSRLHLVTLSLEAIVVIGFWGLRVFFPQGIIADGEERTITIEVLSTWVHLGSFLTMLYFVKQDQIILETSKVRKISFHTLWGVPFICLQTLHWYCTNKHLYGFLQYLNWLQIFVFQASLFSMAVGLDYFFSIRHGYKARLKHLETHHQ